MEKLFWTWMTSALAIAFYLLVTTQGVVEAAPLLVTTDSGSIGNFQFTNTGISGSTATINVSVSRVAGSSLSTIDTVNGAAIAQIPTVLSVPFTFTITPVGAGQYNVVLPAGVTQTIGETAGQQAILGVDITRGTTPVTQSHFFNVSGPVTGVLANQNPSYDFSQFGSLGATINTTFTATTFTGGATSFDNLFTTVGATAIGNGSFSQQANTNASVPEPGSLVTLSLGLASLFTVVQIRRRLLI